MSNLRYSVEIEGIFLSGEMIGVWDKAKLVFHVFLAINLRPQTILISLKTLWLKQIDTKQENQPVFLARLRILVIGLF